MPEKTEMVIFLVVLFFIMLGIFSYITIRSDGSQCLADPLTYGVKSISDKIGSELIMTGTFADNKYSPFIQTREGRKALLSNTQISQEIINWTFEPRAN